MDAQKTPRVWTATPDDYAVAAQLLHDFNVEFAEPSPGPGALSTRLGELIDGGDTSVVLGQLGGSVGAGSAAEAVAVVRFRAALWSRGQEAYLAELYVRPGQRGRGLGRVMLTEVLRIARDAGADWIDLGTSETDQAARALYESAGFTNREGDGGPLMYVYEREL